VSWYKNTDLAVQELAGYAVESLVDFRIKLPHDIRLYEPLYKWIDAELARGVIIGHVITMLGHPNLVVSRITEIMRKNDKIHLITSIPILHSKDIRNIDEIEFQEFYIRPKQIGCILDPE